MSADSVNHPWWPEPLYRSSTPRVLTDWTLGYLATLLGRQIRLMDGDLSPSPDYPEFSPAAESQTVGGADRTGSPYGVQ